MVFFFSFVFYYNKIEVETKFLAKLEEFGSLGMQECRGCPDCFKLKGLRGKQMLRGLSFGVSLSA